MNIALVSSIFIPGLVYIEEGLAKVLTGMGHEVTVFSSKYYPFSSPLDQRKTLATYQTVFLHNSNLYYKIRRLNTLIKLRSNIICVNLKKNISKLNPDLIILVGVSDFFPLAIINKKMANKYLIYAFIGQNFDMWHWRQNHNKFIKAYSFFVNYAIKGFLYRKSIKYLNKLILYTPDTETIILWLISKKLKKVLDRKKINIPLGFNSDDFYFIPEARISVRKDLKIEADRIIFITVTRVDKSKKIDEILNSIHLLGRSDVVYFIIGFINNSSAIEAEQLINKLNLTDRVFCFPFLPISELLKYFSAADFGIWLKSGASIQQAMGTGLPVILPENSTTSELITEGLNGFYIKNNLQDTLSEALSNYSYDIEKRRRIEVFNRNRFSYQSILKEILI